MIKKRRHIFFLTVILVLSIVSAPVFAKGQDKKKDTKDSTQTTTEQQRSSQSTEKSTEAEKNTAYFTFAIYNDENITLADTDIFKITLTDIAGKEHTIELNAYESSTSAVENSLDEGGYTVTSIEYKGINQDIISGGFGLSKQMNLQISDTPEIPFYIGSDSTALSGLFIVRDGKQVKTASEQSTQQTSVTTQDTTNTTETVQDTSEENATESTRKDPDKKDVVEVVKEKKKGKKSQFFPFSFKKLLMAVIILFICGVWTLVFYQKNK